MKRTVVCLYLCTVTSLSLLTAQTALNLTPSRVVGQNSVGEAAKSSLPNVVEGREFFTAWSVAVDQNSGSPALYVSDAGNNRILGWKNATSFTNGQKADFVIGQIDFETTTPNWGPGTARTAFFTTPGAMAVDAQSNLYVVDVYNNRILRFPNPVTQSASSGPILPDMVIGQATISTGNSANAGGLTASSVATFDGNQAAVGGLAFDSSGNLWFSDPLNNRVIRYKASDLSAGTSNPSADLVLGQSSFTTNTSLGTGGQQRILKTGLTTPAGLAFDNSGRLYVADALSRVVVYQPPFTSGMNASRVMGIAEANVSQGGQVTSPNISAYTLNAPLSVFTIGKYPGVVDRGNSRILIYNSFDQWAAESPNPIPAGVSQALFSPPALLVIGQPDFISSKSNRALPQPTESTLATPYWAATLDSNHLFVADTGNNRVLSFPITASGLPTGGIAAADRVLGQDGFQYNAPNLIEGKELFLFNGYSSNGNFSGNFSDGAGVAVDNSGQTGAPHLYIADTFNNRVLGYVDARSVKPGQKADVVIGQPDFSSSVINSPTGSLTVPTAGGLFHPAGVGVDPSGNLWVVDSGNGRVLRYSNPFASGASATGQQPNLVLGQKTLTSKLTDPTQYTMAYPYGISFAVLGDVVVSDVGLNRILYFYKPKTGDFTNGQNADKVIGQVDFFTVDRNASSRRFSNIRGISLDGDDRLYAVDAGQSAVFIYDRVSAPSVGNDPTPALSLTGLSSPQNVYANKITGEIWVANTRNNTALRYPRFDLLSLNPAANYSVPTFAPLGLAQDAFGNLFVAEGLNRVSIFYNAMVALNAANYADARPLSPGMITTLFPPKGSTLSFSDTTKAAGGVPLQTTMADTQVLVNGTAAPLYFVSSGQINFVVPYGVGTSGTADVTVVHPSTGQTVADFTFPVAEASPALFTSGATGGGQVAAINADDNSVNGPSHPVARGHVIELFGTGGGPISGAPPDGQAASGAVSTDIKPDVLIDTAFVDPANVQYSGLAPGFPGLWQINVKVPETTAPSNTVEVVVRVHSALSNRGFQGQLIHTTIAVKQ